MTHQPAVLLKAGKASLEVEQVELPVSELLASASSRVSASSSSSPLTLDDPATAALYTSLWSTEGGGQASPSAIRITPILLNAHLAPGDRIVLVHQSCSGPSSSGRSLAHNKLANELLDATEGTSSSSALSAPPGGIRGDAYVLYSKPGRAFPLKPDWEALHDVCYGTLLERRRRHPTGAPKENELTQLAHNFLATREKMQEAVRSTRRPPPSDKDHDDGGDDDDEAWTDEDVEQPRGKRPGIDDDGDSEEGEDREDKGIHTDEKEEEDGSESESELESDDDGEDNSRQRALLEALRNMILKDGKLDMER